MLRKNLTALVLSGAVSLSGLLGCNILSPRVLTTDSYLGGKSAPRVLTTESYLDGGCVVGRTTLGIYGKRLSYPIEDIIIMVCDKVGEGIPNYIFLERSLGDAIEMDRSTYKINLNKRGAIVSVKYKNGGMVEKDIFHTDESFIFGNTNCPDGNYAIDKTDGCKLEGERLESIQTIADGIIDNFKDNVNDE